MKRIIHIDDRYADDPNISGAKGANLHWLRKHKYKSPSAFVVTSEAFLNFVGTNNLKQSIEKVLLTIDFDSSESIQISSAKVQALILSNSISKEIEADILEILKTLPSDLLFAVRSSASFEDGGAKSWAGQFDTYLNTPREEILGKIRQVWASFFNARALEYGRGVYGSFSTLNVAVVVQQMIPSEYSGIAFSIDPVSGKSDRLYIEATEGLGDKLVSGREIGKSYKIDKNSGRIVSKISEENNLPQMAIKSIYRTICNIERRYAQPVDVEWAMAGSSLHILQVRPITGEFITSPSRTSSFPLNDEYELTFKVAGLSFLFTDMLSDAFSYLDPLFLSDKNANFFQYFTNEKMRYAAEDGFAWLATTDGVNKYFEAFLAYYHECVDWFDTILTKTILTNEEIISSFSYLSNSLKRYSKTDNQFTDAAYSKKDNNAIVAASIDNLAKVKDVARVWINELMIDDGSYYAKLCDVIASQYLIKGASLQQYKISEILDLELGLTISEAENSQRSTAYAISTIDGCRTYWYGDSCLPEISKFSLINVDHKDKEVQGKVASKTTDQITGRAYVIKVDYGNMQAMNTSILEMRDGDILIADFTAPELMAACKKAIAIVTDIGGLLSHAAIISRELNKSCIVGTQLASKVFKTGDFLTLDLGSGIVSSEKK